MTAPSTGHVRSIEYQPALDGLRGVAVAAVLLFHHGVGVARGGYLGVSAFFTLSGFLIASILHVEHDRTGQVSLRRFWVRRARRLLPAAWLCLAGIVVFGHTVATSSQAASLRGDVVAALAYVANWRLLATGGSYEALFAEPSPITHLWSLAIEEQFYLLFPLLTACVLHAVRRVAPSSPIARWATAGTYAGLAIASVVLMAILHDPAVDTARVYYGTDTRAAELLIGAAAGVLYRRRAAVSPALSARRLGPVVLQLAGVVAAAGLALAWARVPQAEPWLYRGGLALHALAVVVVIVAAQAPGPLRRALAFEPVRLLGLVSYGVYLYHWPIYLALDPARTGLDGPALLAVRVGATAVVAIASYVLVERPIRDARLVRGWQAAVVAPVAVVAILVPLVVTTPTGAGDDLAGLPDAPPPAQPVPDRPTVDGGTIPHVAVFGDSTALMLAYGVSQWTRDTSAASYAGGIIEEGCGLTRFGDVDYHGTRRPVHDHCDQWPTAWPRWVEESDADVAVVLVGPWDVADRRLEGDDEWRAPGDPVYDEYLRAEIRTALGALTEVAPTVVWLTSPHIELGRNDVPPPSAPFPASDPERMDRLNAIIAEEVAAWPGDSVHLFDMAEFVAGLPDGGFDPALRPDGVHFTIESTMVVARWLMPQLVELVRTGES